MQTPKIDVLKYMHSRYLPKYFRFETLVIPEWSRRTGKHLGFGKYDMEGWPSTIRVGDRWFAAYESADFFTAEAEIPASFEGHEVRLLLDTGGETLVKVNGKAVGSTTCSPGGQHREEILLGSDLKAGEKLLIELESTVTSMDFCDEAMDGATRREHLFKKAELITVDTVAEGYYFDLQVAFEAMELIQDDRIRAAVYRAVDDSLHLVDFDFEEERVRASIGEAAKLYSKMLGEIKYIPQSEVIFTSHSHIDVAWLWRICESVRKSARTFSNNLTLMDKYPEMTFAQSQAVLYDMMKRTCPEIYERIKEKVKAGQWDIVGNVWVEADTNIASGEALIRQLLYGREFFLKEFGVCSDTYWLPDCFGFTWALPQIIRRSGMKYFLTSKLNNNDTNRFPHTLFRWKGNSGDEVVAYLQRASYNGEYNANDIRWAETSDERGIVNTTMAMFGHGDGGGGAKLEMLERGRRYKAFPGLPATKIGHVSDFFARVDEQHDELPVWNSEMYYENHRGTYTSQAFVKKANRRNEYLLSRGEAVSLFAKTLTGREYPREELEECWKILLTNQFHDILPGSSIHQVYEDARRDYAALTERTTALLDGALDALNSQLNAGCNSIAVWNLTSLPQSCPVSVEVPGEEFGVLGSDGNPLPSTVVKDGERFVLTFTPDSLPPMGVKLFPLSNSACELPVVIAEPERLENSKILVELSENGNITRIYDKVNDREVIDCKGNVLFIAQDKCVHETAWNLEVNYQKKMWELEAESAEVLESSAQRGVLRFVYSFNKSKITQKVILNADSEELVFDTAVDWWETDKVLKAAFDVTVADTEATYEIAHGAIKRPTHTNTSFDAAQFEVCGHKWADLSEGGYGVSLLNDCKYGYDIHGSKMRITLMRSPTCPDRTADHGLNTFVYALYPHKGDWRQAGTVRRALALNIPPVGALIPPQMGQIGVPLSFVTVDTDNVIIDALKPAQDENGIILRLVETQQCRGKVTVKWNLPGTKVCETNLMECDEEELTMENGEFSFFVKPFEVRTFRIY